MDVTNSLRAEGNQGTQDRVVQSLLTFSEKSYGKSFELLIKTQPLKHIFIPEKSKSILWFTFNPAIAQIDFRPSDDFKKNSAHSFFLANLTLQFRKKVPELLRVLISMATNRR